MRSNFLPEEIVSSLLKQLYITGLSETCRLDNLPRYLSMKPCKIIFSKQGLGQTPLRHVTVTICEK